MADLFKLVGRILIEHDEADEVIDNTTQKAKDLGDALKGTGQSADSTGKKIGSSGKFGSGSVWFGNMLTKMTDAAISFGKFVGKTGFTFDANIEAYQNQFTSMIGDADRAQKLVNDIKELAKDTPLGMEGLVVNATSLLGAGVEADDMIDKLIMLGNIGRGTQSAMNSVTKAYRDVMGKGKLMAQELYQFTEAGVNLVSLITEYGGEEYADGSWYTNMMASPQKYAVPFEAIEKAFQNATSEGGKYYNYMYNMMDTWLGQTDRMGEEGKESLGALMMPFFEVAKSDVLPKAAESLALFGQWATENQETLSSVAETVGKFASISFDAVLGFFKWATENGSAVGVALGTIATAFAVGAIAAHPYAAAVVAIAGALAYLNSESGKQRGEYSHLFEGYSESDLQTLQNWVNAVNEAKRAEDAYMETLSDADFSNLEKAWANQDAAYAQANAIDGLVDAYQRWRSTQGQGGNDLYLDVPLQVSDDSEADMQSKIDGMNLEGIVKMYADTSSLNTLYTIASSGGINGSHANGLDYVPHDGYIARLHQGESILTKQEASVWRSGTGGFDVDALASRFASSVMAALSGKPVVLESGAVVGQLLPAIDTGLGTASTRKGRRN